jgi:hypothetical protein
MLDWSARNGAKPRVDELKGGPKRKRVSVTEGEVTRHYGIAGLISCNVLPGEIAVREIFE